MALTFSPEAAKKVQETVARYPDAQAACLPVLHIAQDEFGYLPDDALKLVAATLKLPEAHVFGVVTFYSMFHRHPAGKKAIWVCTNISCMLLGGYEVLHKIEQKLGIKAGETTADGIHLAEEECLAACADAPMAICGPKYYLRLDDKGIDALIADVRSSNPLSVTSPVGGVKSTLMSVAPPPPPRVPSPADTKGSN